MPPGLEIGRRFPENMQKNAIFGNRHRFPKKWVDQGELHPAPNYVLVNPKNLKSKIQNAKSKRGGLDFGFLISDFGFWTQDFGFRILYTVWTLHKIVATTRRLGSADDYLYVNINMNRNVNIEVQIFEFFYGYIENAKKPKNLAGALLPWPGKRHLMFDDVMNLEHYNTFPQVLQLQLAHRTMVGVMKWTQKLLVVGQLG